jgi:hypothetical protein
MRRGGGLENDAAMAPLTSLNFQSRKGGQDWQNTTTSDRVDTPSPSHLHLYSVPPQYLHRIVAGARETERPSKQTN